MTLYTCDPSEVALRIWYKPVTNNLHAVASKFIAPERLLCVVKRAVDLGESPKLLNSPVVFRGF